MWDKISKRYGVCISILVKAVDDLAAFSCDCSIVKAEKRRKEVQELERALKAKVFGSHGLVLGILELTPAVLRLLGASLIRGLPWIGTTMAGRQNCTPGRMIGAIMRCCLCR